MTSTFTHNVTAVCAIVCLAALVGCSSSEDDRSAELQRQLDMRANISPGDLGALQAQIESLMGRGDLRSDAAVANAIEQVVVLA